jgi:hypothetical protein
MSVSVKFHIHSPFLDVEVLPTVIVLHTVYAYGIFTLFVLNISIVSLNRLVNRYFNHTIGINQFCSVMKCDKEIKKTFKTVFKQ